MTVKIRQLVAERTCLGRIRNGDAENLAMRPDLDTRAVQVPKNNLVFLDGDDLPPAPVELEAIPQVKPGHVVTTVTSLSHSVVRSACS